MTNIVTCELTFSPFRESPNRFLRLAGLCIDNISFVMLVGNLHAHAGHFGHHLAMLSMFRRVCNHELMRLPALVDEQKSYCVTFFDRQPRDIETNLVADDHDGSSDL